MIIRQANIEDTFYTAEMVTGAYRELKSDLPLNEFSFAKQMKELIKNPNVGTFVAIDSGRVAGLCQAVVIPAPWDTDKLAACETHWFVKKKYRSSYIGIKLFKTMEKWAESKGATHIMAGLSAESDPRTRKALEKWNYKLLNLQFIKEIQK